MEPNSQLTQAYAALEDALLSHNKQALPAVLEPLNVADVTECIEGMPIKHVLWFLQQVDWKISTQIVSQLSAPTLRNYLLHLDNKTIAQYITYMESDDAAHLLHHLQPNVRWQCIQHVSNEEKVHQLRELIHYDQDLAGGLMAKEIATCSPDWTVKKCKEVLAAHAETITEIYRIYVINKQGGLLGSLSLFDCLLMNDSDTITTAYEQDIPFVYLDTPKEEVVNVMQKYDLSSVAVVNQAQRIMGRITADDIMDVIEEMAERKRSLMAGISTVPQEIRHTVLQVLRARLAWLLIGLGGGIGVAWLMQVFEDRILLLPTLLFFVPLITATAGNIGIQSSSAVLQAFEHPMYYRNRWVVYLLRMYSFAVLSGGVISLILSAILFLIGYDQAWIVCIALFVTTLVSSALGTLAPWVLRYMGFNPVIASGPFITTLNDITGISIYIGMVSWFAYG